VGSVVLEPVLVGLDALVVVRLVQLVLALGMVGLGLVGLDSHLVVDLLVDAVVVAAPRVRLVGLGSLVGMVVALVVVETGCLA